MTVNRLMGSSEILLADRRTRRDSRSRDYKDQIREP